MLSQREKLQKTDDQDVDRQYYITGCIKKNGVVLNILISIVNKLP